MIRFIYFPFDKKINIVLLVKRYRIVNGPTNSGPNPTRTRKYKPEPGPKSKTNLKPKSYPKKNESWVRFEKFSNVAKF